MAATKANATLLSAVTTTQTSSAQDTSGDYADDLYVSIAQVGTATTAASFIVQWSEDAGTTYYNSQTYTAGLTAGTYYWTISIPSTATNVKVAFTQQSGGTSSTCTAQLGRVTGI
jgi:hypothetical protein